VQIPFGLQSYQHISLPLSAQRMVNSYLETAPPAAKTAAAVLGCFGIRDYLTVGDGPLRGGVLVNTLGYVVSGSALYSITPAGVVAKLGVIPGAGPVFMASDGSHLMVTANGPAMLWDGKSLTQITDPDFPGYQWLAYLDGYMIGSPGNNTFYINHTPFDPTAWNALDFASAEGSPDDIIVGLVNHRELFLFKREKTEVWYNSGAADFPLTRTASGYMEIGIASKFGAVNIDNTVYFAASDGTHRRVEGYTPIRISTNAIEQAVAKFAPQQCMAHAWIESGHAMVSWTYKEGTFVYDISTQLWHERQSYSQPNWRAAFVLRGNNVIYVGDRTSNRVGILDAQIFAEWDQVLVSEVTSPAIAQENAFIQHGNLDLIFEQGVGTVTGQGQTPKVMLQWSDDGGRTWSNELHRSLGQRGDFLRMARFLRLGQSRDRVYRYRISDPVRRTLIQALLNNAA